MTAELVVFALLLVATATLAGRSPVVADDAPVGLAPVSAELSPIAGTVTVTVSPGAVGANIIELTVLNDTGRRSRSSNRQRWNSARRREGSGR